MALPLQESYVDKIARLRSLGRLVPMHEQSSVSLYFELADVDPSTDELVLLFNQLTKTSQAYIRLCQEVSSS